jgi:3-hydroxybutyryl-CoA dehydrogenase
MGSGIAQVAAQIAQYSVLIIDTEKRFIDKALSSIERNLDNFWLAKGKIDKQQMDECLARISGSVNFNDISTVDYVIEAAPEKLDLKIDIFNKLDALCAADIIFTTNTSSLSITRIAAATKRPHNVAGMHFSNPVQIMKRLEIVKGLVTSDETIKTVKQVGIKMGKEPQITKKDYPGFTGNRFLNLLVNEAFNMVISLVWMLSSISQNIFLLSHRIGINRLRFLKN